MAIVKPKPAPSWSSRLITRSLATDAASRFHFTTQFTVLPNVTGMVGWEADLLVCSRAGFMTEVEVKISAGDWRADAAKRKWERLNEPECTSWPLIKYFYYAAPLDLAQRWPDFGIPDFAGVLGMQLTGDRCWHQLVKPAKARPGHRKLSDAEMAKLARLGALRIWGMP